MYAACGLLNMLGRCWLDNIFFFFFFFLFCFLTFSFGKKKIFKFILGCYLLYASELSVNEKSKIAWESSDVLCAVCVC